MRDPIRDEYMALVAQSARAVVKERQRAVGSTYQGYNERSLNTAIGMAESAGYGKEARALTRQVLREAPVTRLAPGTAFVRSRTRAARAKGHRGLPVHNPAGGEAITIRGPKNLAAIIHPWDGYHTIFGQFAGVGGEWQTSRVKKAKKYGSLAAAQKAAKRYFDDRAKFDARYTSRRANPDTGGKATLYVKGTLGISKVEGRLESVDEHAIHFVPKGGRKARWYAGYYYPFMMVVKGWGLPAPDSPWQADVDSSTPGVTIRRGQYRGHDPRWVSDFMQGPGRGLRPEVLFQDGKLVKGAA